MQREKKIPIVSPQRKRAGVLAGILVIGLILISLLKLNLSFRGGFSSIGKIAQLFGQLFSMDFTDAKDVFIGAAVSLSVAFLATVLSALAAFFVAFAAASNVSNNYVASIIKGITGVIRAVPTLIWTLIFVAYLGLGPFPGVLGLSFHSFAYLVKAYSQSMEEVDPGKIEALRGVGANFPQIMKHGVFTPVKTALISWTALRFEINVGQSSILGLVGAGGIGQELSLAMRGFQFGKAGFIILVIFVMSFSIEMLFHRFKMNVDHKKHKGKRRTKK